MSQDKGLPPSLAGLVEGLGRPVTSSDVDTYGRLQEILSTTFGVRVLIEACQEQQRQDRQMREKYGRLLLWLMVVQVAAIHVVYLLMGFGVVQFEPWTARTFIMAVFAETAALVLLVVRYLFRPSSDNLLRLVSEMRRGKTHAD